MRRLLVAGVLLLFPLLAVSCACKDKTLVSGAGNDFRPCSMNCVDRGGKRCDCSGRCPCWRLVGGKRIHKRGS